MNRPQAVALRLACDRDADVLAAMSRELIEVGLGWRYTPRRIAGLIRDRETLALVACDPSGVQGFAITCFGDEAAHLTLLCVRAVQQRRGIGRRLLEWTIESARVAGMAAIQVELRAGNAAALAFYRRLGFTEIALVPGYYGGEFAARRMVLRLRPEALAS